MYGKIYALTCFIFLLLSLSSTAYGQLQKGMTTFQQFGDIQYSNFNEISVFSFGGAIERAKLVSDRIMIGTGLGASYTSNQGTNIYRLSATPFGRFYFNPTQPKTNFFVGIEAEIFSTFGDFDGGTNTSIFPHLGASHFLYPDLSILARAGIFFPLDIPDISIVNFQFSFEPFFTTESWQERKSQNNGLASGTWFVQDPFARFAFVNNGSTINIRSGIGHMISQKFALGAFLNFSSFSRSSTSYTLQAFTRFYLSQNRTSWYLEAQGGPTILSSPNNDSRTIYEYGLGGGFNKFLSPRIALDAQLGLNIIEGITPTNRSVLVGSLGMQYMLRAQ